MADDAEELAEVQRRLAEIRLRKRGRIRWSVGARTAELAIDALGGGRRQRRPTAKSRRRKRHKRLL
jgi:hypothetical protein